MLPYFSVPPNLPAHGIFLSVFIIVFVSSEILVFGYVILFSWKYIMKLN